MEAKVDVRKLQLLNDRITQTIEALNQVRLSVHGLGHTPPAMPFTPSPIPFPAYGFGMTPSFPPFPGVTPSFPPFPGVVPPAFGLQHTPFVPFTPYTPFTPFNLPNIPGFVPPFLGGLSHTSPELIEQKLLEIRAADPYRMIQTFPFINTPYWVW
jgi:hypothetical protein